MPNTPSGRRPLLLRLPPWSVGLGLVVPLLLSALLVGLARRERQRALHREAATLADGISADLAERMAYYRTFALSLAADPHVHDLLAPESPARAEVARQALLMVARATRNSIDQLRVIDLAGAGRLWVGFDDSVQRYTLRQPDPTAAVLKRDWFLQGSALARGVVWNGPAEVFRGYGRWVHTPGHPVEPYLRLVVPVFSAAGGRLGIVVVNLKIDGRAFEGRGEERPWRAIDGDGHFIYSATGFRNAQPAEGGKRRIPTLQEEFALAPSALTGPQGELPVAGGRLFYRRFTQAGGTSWFLLRFTSDADLHGFSLVQVLGLVAIWALSIALLLLAFFGLRNLRTQRERERLAQLLDAILRAPTGLGLLVAEPAGRVLRINAGAQAIFGIQPEEAGGFLLQDLVGPLAEEPEPVDPDAPALPDRGPGAYRTIRRRSDGQAVLVSLGVTPLKHPGGDTFGSLVQVQDVGLIQAREEMLRTAAQEARAAARMKSAFLATMSHEIRTPMNGILGMVRVLKATDLESEQAEILEVGERAAGELLRLLDSVLDLSKLESGRVAFEAQPFSPAQLTRDCAALWRLKAQSRGLAFTEELPPDAGLALGDALRLRQVLNNLLGNACKFTDAGGVTLRLRAVPAGPLLDLAWEVSDTGPGIAASEQERIFEPFTQVDGESTRTHGGTGLGLAICREIAVHMGGCVEVESAPGQGSTFRLRLALPRPEAD